MKWINLSELFRQPDWPQTLTQQQTQKLLDEKLHRAYLYSLLHSRHKPTLEDTKCTKLIQPQSHGAQPNK
jgi:hypothetical protein